MRNEMNTPDNNHDRVQSMQQRYVEYDRKTHSLEDEWDSPAYVFGWRHRGGYFGHHLLRCRLIEMLNRKDIHLASKKILDIGCGYGHMLRFFAEIRGDSGGLSGVDVSPHRLRRARSINPGIEFIDGDVLSLPYHNESFDIVSQFSVFEAFDDGPILNKAVSEAGRVLAPGGLFMWSNLLPVPANWKLRVRGYSLEQGQGQGQAP